MPIVPNRLLVRMCHPCLYVKDSPRDDDTHLVDLPEGARIDNFAALDEKTNFADVRLAWNDFGLAVQLQVKGKEQPPTGDALDEEMRAIARLRPRDNQIGQPDTATDEPVPF